jgi:hypothetical protein
MTASTIMREVLNDLGINGVLFGATFLSLATALPEISSGTAGAGLCREHRAHRGGAGFVKRGLLGYHPRSCLIESIVIAVPPNKITTATVIANTIST